MSELEARTAFDDLAEDLSGRGVVSSQMFGKRALKHESKAFACLLGSTLALKLMAGTAEHAEALALPGAELFDPSGKHRPMKDWVAVPVACAEHWRPLAVVSLERLRPAESTTSS
ncbi:hypothetical protein AB0395_16695 [Streptosporangium sp. NPDC051023]|uniref:hypothetical protein n=1 Tax=Streptosporangium sp. NPDC051023 TaxID=3155410 RepID=UPI00344C2649